MKGPSLFIISVLLVFFFTSVSQAKQHIRHNYPANAAKPKSSIMQKQLVSNAKAVVKTYEKDLKAHQSRVEKAKIELTQAEANHKAALAQKKQKDPAEKIAGRAALSPTSRKLVEASEALKKARREQAQVATKHAYAQSNLNGLVKHGWETFFALQRSRVDKSKPAEASVGLPRLRRNSAGSVDNQQYTKDMANMKSKHAYNSQ